MVAAKKECLPFLKMSLFSVGDDFQLSTIDIYQHMILNRSFSRSVVVYPAIMDVITIMPDNSTRYIVYKNQLSHHLFLQR